MKRRIYALAISLSISLSTMVTSVAFNPINALANDNLADVTNVIDNFEATENDILTLQEGASYSSFTPNNIISENKNSFEGVVADEKADGSVRIVFPAMDKTGKIIVSDPEKSLRATDTDGNLVEFGLGPNIQKGVVVNFDNYTPDGSTRPSEEKDSSITGNKALLNGLSFTSSSSSAIGDVNLDGSIDATDVTAVIKHIVDPIKYTFTENQSYVADVTNDNKVDASDVTAIVKHIVAGAEFIKKDGDTKIDTTDPNKYYFVNKNGDAQCLDTNVLTSSGYATAYRVELSSDGGQTWSVDGNQTRISHGKKIARLAYLDTSVELDNSNRKNGNAFLKNADGSIKYVQPGEAYTYIESGSSTASNAASWKEDTNNTYYLVDQKEYNIDTTLTPNTTYKVRVSAINYNDRNKENPEVFGVYETSFTTADRVQALAFPTVEGGGSYSTGGRGTIQEQGDVYVVTNLDDDVKNPQPGSFRYGLKRLDRADKNSSYPRTIVFAVGGTINIDPTASKGERHWDITDNTSVLGQTAPGEGITLAGGTIKFNGENIVTRYMRFRLGSGYDADGGSAAGKNIVVDHCTFSWGVDEVFSPKAMINSSIQYNIITNGLSVVNKNGDNNNDAELLSGESEAKHGMATISNGYESTFTHNLYANSGTRMPRFEGKFDYNYNNYTNKMEFSNNVIYNWGHQSGYGGDRGEAKVNYLNNYLKPGPNTLEKVKTRIFDCDTDSNYGNVKSSYYFGGNVMASSQEVTNNNDLGFKDIETDAIKLDAPVQLSIPYTAESAEDAYNNVLNSVGASYVRDAIDSRLIEDVKNGTGTHINDPIEAGGYNTKTWTSSLKDTDNDGIPDDVEKEYGTDPNKVDSTTIITDENSPYYMYSYLEVYANGLLGEWKAENGSKLTANVNNPTNTITSIKDENGNEVLNTINTVITAGKDYTVTVSNTSDSFRILLNDEEISTNGKFNIPVAKAGSYKLIVETTNKDGLRSMSLAVPVSIVKADESIALSNDLTFTAQKIRDDQIDNANYTSSDYSGVARTYEKDGKNSLYIEGVGRIGGTSTSKTGFFDDDFYYYYTKVSGDYSITAKIDNWARLNYYQKAGIMFRKSLDTTSEFYMPAYTLLKGEDYETAKDISGGPILGRNIVSFSRDSKNNGNTVVTEGNKLAIPQKRASQEPNYGWIRVTKKGSTVTVEASVNNEKWYTLNTYECGFDDEYYIGFAVASPQDTCDEVAVNKAEFSNIEITKITE